MNKLFHRWLMTGPTPQDIISFSHQQGFSGAAFIAHVADLQRKLSAQPAKRWLLSADSNDLFAAGLCAALLAGKHIILASNIQDGTLTELEHEFDALLSDQLDYAQRPKIILAKSTLSPPSVWPVSSTLGELVLFTSGSSGQPKAIRKTVDQLDEEISNLELTFGKQLAGCSVVSNVPHQHIYGLLFSILWPLAAARPFLNERIDYPETLTHYLACTDKVCLISSPAQLSRLPAALEYLSQAHSPEVIFSSGGPLSFEAAQAIKRCFQRLAIEVFGSTETGGIAYRCQQEASQAWQVFPGLAIDTDPQDGALLLQSPYLTQAQNWHRCDDKIEQLSATEFRLLHRLDRIIKIEEKRVSLVQVEQLLLAHPYVEAIALAVIEQPRVMLGAAICLTAQGKQALEENGKLSMNNLLKKQLLSQLERVTLPRRWRYLQSLPFNSQGKLTQATLLSLFSND
jgi:acyl-coenzyme A synthetase/AMP-(fatty) acid ligase